jgi:hypothetical protein
MCFILRFGSAHASVRCGQKGNAMTSSTQEERWKELCQAIVEEPDSNRLMELVHKLNRVLEEREIEFKRRNHGAGLARGGGG